MQVTLLTAYQRAKDDPNIEAIVNPEFESDRYVFNAFEDQATVFAMKMGITLIPDLCSKSLASEQTQNLFKRKFDLIIISHVITDCYYSLVHHMKVIQDSYLRIIFYVLFRITYFCVIWK